MDNGNGQWDGCGTFPAKDRCITAFGVASDQAVVGDWGGDGFAKIGVKRGNMWYLDYDGNGVWNKNIDHALAFGNPSDKPIAGYWWVG